MFKLFIKNFFSKKARVLPSSLNIDNQETVSVFFKTDFVNLNQIITDPQQSFSYDFSATKKQLIPLRLKLTTLDNSEPCVFAEIKIPKTEISHLLKHEVNQFNFSFKKLPLGSNSVLAYHQTGRLDKTRSHIKYISKLQAEDVYQKIRNFNEAKTKILSAIDFHIMQLNRELHAPIVFNRLRKILKKEFLENLNEKIASNYIFTLEDKPNNNFLGYFFIEKEIDDLTTCISTVNKFISFNENIGTRSKVFAGFFKSRTANIIDHIKRIEARLVVDNSIGYASETGSSLKIRLDDLNYQIK